MARIFRFKFNQEVNIVTSFQQVLDTILHFPATKVFDNVAF